MLLVASLLFALVALRQAWTDGLTYDEAFYLADGLHAVHDHDLRVVPEAPPLAHVVAALPTLVLHPTVPHGRSWAQGDRRPIVADLLRAQGGPAEVRRLVFAARIAPILETIAVAWCAAVLADALFGAGAGELAGLLWLASPLVLGMGHLDAMDVPAALTALIAALAVHRYFTKPSALVLALVGVAGGVAVLTRVTGLLVVAAAMIAVAAAPAERTMDRIKRPAIVLAVAWATLSLGYFTIEPGPLPTSVSAIGTTALRFVAPPAFRTGLAMERHAGLIPGPAMAFGHYHVGRWGWFWPQAMLLKLTLPVLVCLLLAPVAIARLRSVDRRTVVAVLGLPVLLISLFVVQQERPIGVRYLAAPLAIAMVGAGAVAVAFGTRVRVAALATVALAGLLAAAGPSIAWTPPGLGDGYRLIGDSGLDWGQSYPALVRWGRTHPAYVDYFGPAGSTVAGVPNATSLRHAPDDLTGWVAASASLVTVYSHDRLAWLRGYCPVGVLDRTILVYRFRSPPDRGLSSAQVPDVPPAPCDGGWSRPIEVGRAP